MSTTILSSLLGTYHTLSLNFQNNPMRYMLKILLSPIYKWENWGRHRELKKIAQVTELVCGSSSPNLNVIVCHAPNN